MRLSAIRPSTRLLALLAAPLLAAASHAQISVNGSTVTVQNTHFSFEVDQTTGSITKLTDRDDGFSYLISNTVPWKLGLRDVTSSFGISYHDPSTLGANPPLFTPISGESLIARFAWYAAIDGNNSVVVTVDYRLLPNDRFLRASIEVLADGTFHAGLNQTPLTTTMAIADSRLYLTPFQSTNQEMGHYGMLSARGMYGVVDPATTVTVQNSRLGQCGPGTQISCSIIEDEDGLRGNFHLNKVLGAYWNEAGQGLYGYPEQVEGFQYIGSAYLSVPKTGGNGFQMTHIEQYSYDDTPGRNVASSRPLRIGVYQALHSGEEGWFSFARLYREYLLDSTNILSRGKVSARTDLPAHIKDGSLVIGFFGLSGCPPASSFQSADYRAGIVNMYSASRAYLGASELAPFFYFGWNESGSSCYTQYQPQPGLGQLFLDMRAASVRPWAYVLSHAVAACDPAYTTLLAGNAFAKNINGQVQTGGYGTCPQTMVSPVVSITGAWTNYMVPKVTSLSTTYGLGGFYFDGPYPGPVDYGGTAGNPRGPGRHIAAGTAQELDLIRASGRLSDPGFLTISEDLPEYGIPFQDLSGGDGSFLIMPLLFNTSNIGNYIGSSYDIFSEMFTTAVFHEFAPTVALSTLISSWAVNNFAGPEYFLAKTVIEGGNVPFYLEHMPATLGGCGTTSWATPNHLAQCSASPQLAAAAQNYALMGKRLVAFRKNSRYLVDGSWWPRVPSDIPTSPQGFHDIENWSLPVSEVVNSVWKASDGDLGIFFANTTGSAKTITFSVPPERYAIPSDGPHSLYQSKPEGRVQPPIVTQPGTIQHTFTIQPHEVVLFELE